MAQHSDPLDIMVYQLLRSTGGSRMFPDEVTPMGLKRRLTKLRAQYGREPEWEHPEVQAALVRVLARRITDFALPKILNAWVSEYQGKDRTRLVQAIGRAVAVDDPLAQRGAFKAPGVAPPDNLLIRMIQAHGSLLDQWAQVWPEKDLVLPDGFEDWRRWVMVGARTRVDQGATLPGTPGQWATVVRVHQCLVNEEAQADLTWLLAQRPDLAQAGHFDHPDWPVLASRFRQEAHNAAAAQHLLAHPAALDAPAAIQWTKGRSRHNPWLLWHNVLPSDLQRNPLPVWMLMGLQGHSATPALMARAARPERDRFLNLQAVMVANRQGGDGDTKPQRMDEVRKDLQRLATVVCEAPAWRNPATLMAPTETRTGDTHPLWVALQRESRLAGAQYNGTPYVPGFREAMVAKSHRLKACDLEGANLWWAMADQRERHVDSVRQVLGLLDQHGVTCQPDHQGRGLFHRHPWVTQVFRQAQAGTDDEIICNYTENPFWDAMQKHPEGFFGSTPAGQVATTQAMWKDVEKRGWYKEELSKAYAPTMLFLAGFDQKNPAAYHPSLCLMVTTMLAVINHYRDRGAEDMVQWAPDPTHEAVSALMDTPFYAYVADKNPALTAVMRMRAHANHVPTQSRRRWRT